MDKYREYEEMVYDLNKKHTQLKSKEDKLNQYLSEIEKLKQTMKQLQTQLDTLNQKIDLLL